MRKKWVFGKYDKDRVAALALACGISPFAALLLSVRGIDTPEAVRAFFDFDTPLTDPFLLCDMDKAAACVRAAVESGERICVYGDYDADGVSATAVLYSYLDAVGADVTFYIPSRTEEGYGLHAAAVDRLADEGVRLIVTVDTGITAFEAAERAYARSVKLVVTDHHRPESRLPRAEAVVDPHRPDDRSGLDCLAGVGVAYKLICAVEGETDEDFLSEYAQFVAVGTVADIMPLTGENRKIVIRGLDGLNNDPKPGLRALADSAGLGEKRLGTGHIAFNLAPRINASGRMGSAETALKLLLCESPDTAEMLAAELEHLNTLRHSAEEAISEEIDRMIASGGKPASGAVLVAAGKGWHEGVVGIAASRAVEKYGRPAVVLTVSDDGRARGSCRSTGSFSIYDALHACGSLLTRFGGHALAAGLELPEEKIDALRERLNEYAADRFPEPAAVEISCKLNPAGVTMPLLDSLEMLEPYGAGNPRPVFAFCGMEVVSLRAIGGGKHTRVELRRKGTTLTAVKFGIRAEEFPFACGDKIDIAAVLEKNEYGGRVYPSVQIRDMRYAGTDEETLFASYSIYRRLSCGLPLTERERETALPDRAVIARVYRLIRSGQGAGGEETFLHRLQLPEDQLCRLSVALRALTDCGLIARTDDGYQIVPDAPRADLRSVPLLAALGYRE